MHTRPQTRKDFSLKGFIPPSPLVFIPSNPDAKLLFRIEFVPFELGFFFPVRTGFRQPLGLVGPSLITLRRWVGLLSWYEPVKTRERVHYQFRFERDRPTIVLSPNVHLQFWFERDRRTEVLSPNAL